MCISQQPPLDLDLYTSPTQGNIQNPDFTVQDVSCNFYNYTLTTNNL